MSKMTGILAIPSMILAIGCAIGPSGQTFDSPLGDWSETHEKRSGGSKTVKLTITDKTTGTGSDGVLLDIYSSGDDYTWKAYWILESGIYACAEKKRGSPYWGEQVFNFNQAYNQYTGTWDSCGEGQKFWTRGNR